MAVRAAQYVSNASSHDLRNRVRSNDLEKLQVLQGGARHTGNIIEASTQGLTHSELTSNASGSRKRSRDHLTSTTLSQPHPSSGTPTPHQFPMKTSDSQAEAAVSTPLSPLLQDLGPQLYQQSVEIDALVRLQSERLRSGLEEATKRHRRALLSVLGQQVAKRLREKDAELACASRRSAELEEKVRQMASESQIWFNVARNNEAIASSLRTTLDQVALVQNTDATLAEADDAQSCCFEGAEKEELRWRLGCRVCREREACVLLLPCRHLCLCNDCDCEPSLNSCPVCHSTKNATLQIFMS